MPYPISVGHRHVGEEGVELVREFAGERRVECHSTRTGIVRRSSGTGATALAISPTPAR